MAEASSKQLLDDDDGLPCPAPGDVIAGKYRVEKVVGMGGMGVVLAARHVTLGQSVAIKVLRLTPDEAPRRTEAHARFLREGQAAARLTSEHVVRIQDVGTTDEGEPFLVMELLSGADLGELLVRHGPAPIDMAVACVHQACDAVGEAHAHGIVHRDLKPSNLFLSRRSDGRPHVKVLDFGISKALSSTADEELSRSLTATRTVVGSPYYMSPEQVRDAKRVDERTDIWSLGMILYELIAGEPAFHAETLPGMCAAIAADTPPSLAARRNDVPPALESVVMRCLEKDPGKRFPSVRELARALAPFLPQAPASSAAAWLADAPLLRPSRVHADAPTAASLELSPPFESPAPRLPAYGSRAEPFPTEFSGPLSPSAFTASVTMVSPSAAAPTPGGGAEEGAAEGPQEAPRASAAGSEARPRPVALLAFGGLVLVGLAVVFLALRPGAKGAAPAPVASVQASGPPARPVPGTVEGRLAPPSGSARESAGGPASAALPPPDARPGAAAPSPTVLPKARVVRPVARPAAVKATPSTAPPAAAPSSGGDIRLER